VTWACARAGVSEAAREACEAALASMPSDLGTDVQNLEAALQRKTAGATNIEDDDFLIAALQYRVLKKQLLSAAAGKPGAEAATSAFVKLPLSQ